MSATGSLLWPPQHCGTVTFTTMLHCRCHLQYRPCVGLTVCTNCCRILPLLQQLAALPVPLVLHLVQTTRPLLPAMLLLPCVYVVASAGSCGTSAAAYVALTGQCLAAVVVRSFMASFDAEYR
jgi:hypothetical protein